MLQRRLSPRIDNGARVLPARGIDDRIDLLDRAGQTTIKQPTARITRCSFYSITRFTLALPRRTVSLAVRRNR